MTNVAPLTAKQIADIAAELLNLHLEYDIAKDSLPWLHGRAVILRPQMIIHKTDDMEIGSARLFNFTAETIRAFMDTPMRQLAFDIRDRHKGGFVFAGLEIPRGLDMADCGVSEQVQVRLTRGYNVADDRMFTRIECLVVDLS